MVFFEKLKMSWKKADSLLCVGLDPDPKRFPDSIKGFDDAIFRFCRAIIDETAEFACAFKPQIAYFHAERAEDQLEALCRYIRKHCPHIPIILDAKRGDIGPTASQYAREAFERYEADAVTLNPYMGFDSVEPYLQYRDKGVIILCRTSNPGGSDLQFLNVSGQGSGRLLYQHVADIVANDWNSTGQCALVVGATYTQELAAVRSIAGDMPLLVPGIGAQGGDIGKTVKAGQTADGLGLMLNSSRAILYAEAEAGESFARASRRVAQKTRDEINRYRR